MKQLVLLVLFAALSGCSRDNANSVTENAGTEKSAESAVPVTSASNEVVVNLSPANWPAGEFEYFMAAQDVDRTSAGTARGFNGAVTVAYSGLAARAGLEALQQGGNAIDAAMTTAMTQIALTAGAPISYFGMMSLVYYDAASAQTYTMNAEWNTVKGETDPLSIPGGVNMNSEEGLRGLGEPSGRTALVGGFMKGVASAHDRFGKLPFAQLFEPSIYIAEQGMPVTAHLADQIQFRAADLSRLPDTKAIFTKPDGTLHQHGDLLKQPALAQTLRNIAEQGVDYMYTGPWAEKLIAAVQADGGKMTLEDLAAYEVIWDEPLVGEIGNGYVLKTNPLPNAGGIAMIEAQNLAAVSGLVADGHFTTSAVALRKALDITQLIFLPFLPPEMVEQIFPGLDISPENRLTQAYAEDMWARMEAGATLSRWAEPGPKHSDDVVVIDKDGNIAAITHTINSVYWGKTGIFVDGVSISDAASFQQAAIARVTPGERLPSPTQTGILFKNGVPALGFASMGSGLHQRTFQGLLNFTQYGMSVTEAINTPDFFLPSTDPVTFQSTLQIPAGKFSREVLDELGIAYIEVPAAEARLSGEGKWVAISRNAETGELEAASHNRNNSDALAY
jgi:gamma-glutamyltranspeptidase/glutathione hydrolase